MSLFGKKACPVCNNKIGFFAFSVADDVKICSACEKLLRGKYNMVKQGAVFFDTLETLDIEKAIRIINDMKDSQKEDILKLSDKYKNIISVLDSFAASPDALDEGGKEIKKLYGKYVALSFCELGTFKEGDRVTIFTENSEAETDILSLIPCTGAYPFENELVVGIHKKEVFENSNAWLVLDIDYDKNIKINKIVKD